VFWPPAFWINAHLLAGGGNYLSLLRVLRDLRGEMLFLGSGALLMVSQFGIFLELIAEFL